MTESAHCSKHELTVAIGGFGAIGQEIAGHLDRGVPGLKLVAVSARDHEKALRQHGGVSSDAVPVLALGDLAERADVVVECAPAAFFREIAEPALETGRTFLPLSVGALLVHDDLVALAERSGGRIVVPTGALLGLDAVRAAAEGEIESVTMVTRKPPDGLDGRSLHLWSAASTFPNSRRRSRCSKAVRAKGAKVAFLPTSTLLRRSSLAGIGPDRTRLEIWADPGVTRNTHRITVEADSTRFEMAIENIPTDDRTRAPARSPHSAHSPR